MNFSRLNTQYVSLKVINNGLDSNGNETYNAETDPNTSINASISQMFNPPLLDKASDYVCAIERMELSLNGIPFYEGGEDITVVEKGNEANTTVKRFNTIVYSLTQLFSILNRETFIDPTDVAIPPVPFTVTFSMNKEGFCTFKLNGGKRFDDIFFIFPRRLNMILGISTADQKATSGNLVTSVYNRIDLGDPLRHIVLVSNLQTTSDTIGNVPLPVLTDFAPPSSYSNSLTYLDSGALDKSGWSTNVRQKIIYNPTERRYLDLIAPFQIQSVTISAVYVDMDDNNDYVPLPLGGIFDIKIGFYKKT